MSSYNRLIILFILTILFGGNISAISPVKTDNRNDALILLALDYEINKDYKNSSLLYEELFKRTNEFEYLNKAMTQSIVASNFKLAEKLALANLDKYEETNEKFYRFAVVALLKQEKLDKSLEIAKKLLKKYNNAMNYEVIGNVYYARGEYKKASEYFESAYATDTKPSALISLTNILYVYLNEKVKAISYLETFIRLYGCNNVICNKLISYYQEEQNIEGMISVLKTAFKEHKNSVTQYKILSLLIDTLEKQDIKQAIKFLEEEKVDDTRLLLLYERAGQYKKALKLVRKLYRKTKNKSLLGQIAILEFEMADDKKSMMKHVVANFELALQVTNNASYKNYYGYLLIDFELNIPKGLKLVKEALKSSPNNIAYMDSVAWGNFKLGKCDEAFKYMKKVVDEVGLDNQEIKMHWDKIRECKK